MNKYKNLAALQKAFSEGESMKFLYFWGHRPSRDGAVIKTCFSQWWAGHPFIVEGVEYPTAEHWMMAEKARLFNDEKHLQLILDAKTAAEAKKIGRKVESFEQSKWEAARMDIVVLGNFYKFSQNEDLKTFLLQTHERILVEASPYDKIWGIGLTQDQLAAKDPSQWDGLNLLGFALMEVRKQLLEL